MVPVFKKSFVAELAASEALSPWSQKVGFLHEWVKEGALLT